VNAVRASSGEGEEGPEHTRGYETAERAHRPPEQAGIAEQLAASVRGLHRSAVPARLCETCLQNLPVSGVSVSVTQETGVRATLCASDGVAAHLAEIQDTLGDGPCLEASALKAPVFATDLTGGADARRWPVFAPHAVNAGIEAVYSLPLGHGTAPLGTVDLYRQRAGYLNEREVRIALQTADALTLALVALHHESPDDGEGGVPWLEGAEASHEEVHQATGMIMMQLDVGPGEALARMRGRAFSEGRTISEIAKDIVERTNDFDGSD
jgi:hypothetical protein